MEVWRVGNLKKSPFKRNIAIKASHYPKDRVAVVYGDKQYSWKDVNKRVNKLAFALKKLGLRKGDKCCIMMRNCPEFIESNFAIQALGAVPVPVNYRYVAKELEYVVNNCDAVFFIFEENYLSVIQEARASLPKVQEYICFGKEIPTDMLDYEAIIEQAPAKRVKAKIEEDDVCIICYTGGTTGRPKGVMLTYDNLESNVESVINLLTTILPPVDELELEVFAKNEFQRRLLEALDLVVGSLFIMARDDYLASKVIAFDSPIAQITLATREDKIKLFHGVTDEADLSIYANLGEHLRDLAAIIPLGYSRRGKLKLFPKLLWRFMLGGIKMKGPHRLRWKLIRALMKRDPDEELLSILLIPPLFHMAGYIFLITWIALGGKCVFPASKKYDPREILELIQNENVRWTLMVPVMWKRILEHPDIDKFDLSSLTIGLSGGALFRGKHKKQLLHFFPNALCFDGFGLTEMSPLTTVKLDGDVEEVKERSIGKLLAGIECRIVNENGEDCKEDEIGELWYRGPTLMKGYYGDDQKTKEAIDEEGWFHSGDLAYRDKDGEIYIVERIKECINSGAEKIFPLEVEEVILDNPKVDNVCVIGVPDEEWGESVRAVVIPKKDKTLNEQEIINWCKGKIASYKKPKSVLFTKTFPLTPVGKVQRAKVKKIFGAV
ncbi:MAG: acyl--CoA ligase [Candidatus Helarchaeota archaeon]|nr:acyl--CoA ligase [Candidatus Helarchaeota archaeon]